MLELAHNQCAIGLRVDFNVLTIAYMDVFMLKGTMLRINPMHVVPFSINMSTCDFTDEKNFDISLRKCFENV